MYNDAKHGFQVQVPKLVHWRQVVQGWSHGGDDGDDDDPPV